MEITEEEKKLLGEVLDDYARELGIKDLDAKEYISRIRKYVAITTRPYGNLYAY